MQWIDACCTQIHDEEADPHMWHNVPDQMQYCSGTGATITHTVYREKPLFLTQRDSTGDSNFKLVAVEIVLDEHARTFLIAKNSLKS